MGGSGGGGQKTESKAEYPEEFKPLAESARKQIEALQSALPLASFAQFQPAGVAGLSPLEQFGIEELVMRTPYLPAAFEHLMALPEPVGAASEGVVKAGRGSKGAEGALDYLSGFLGRNVRPEPAATARFQGLTRLPMPETAFPGLSASQLEASRPGIATSTTPMIQPSPLPPAVQGPPPAAPAPAGVGQDAFSLLPGGRQVLAAQQLSALHGGLPIITMAEAQARGLLVDGAGQAFAPQEFGTGHRPEAVVIIGTAGLPGSAGGE